MKWSISQLWSKLLFINSPIDIELLRPQLPDCFDIDLYQNQAFISIVPFKMSQVRFPYTPRLPFSSLWELNLRTYVSYKGKPGIYFFTLDTDHKLAQWIAKKFFNLPYRYRKLSADVTRNSYDFHAQNSLHLKASIGKDKIKNDLDRWLVERYRLFTINQHNEVYQGDVEHSPWQLKEAKIVSLIDKFSVQFETPLDLANISCFYSDSLPVSFKPFKKVS